MSTREERREIRRDIKRRKAALHMLAREKWQIRTIAVLEMVFKEREQQVDVYGHNEDLEPGFGPGVPWLMPIAFENTSENVESLFRLDYEMRDKPTWMHLIREEIAEAFKEEPGSPEAITELVQVMALCSSYIEKHIDRCPGCGDWDCRGGCL